MTISSSRIFPLIWALTLSASFSHAQKPQQEPQKKLQTIEIVTEVATWDEMAAIWHANTGRKMLVSSEARQKSFVLQRGGYTDEEYKQGIAALLDTSGLEMVEIGQMDIIRPKLQPMGLLPPVVSTQHTGEGLEPEKPKEPEHKETVEIRGVIGNVRLSKEHETGIDWLTAMGAIHVTNSGAALAYSAVGKPGPITISTNATTLDKFLKLIDTDNDFHATSRPHLLCNSGETAEISSGQRVAVPSQTLTSNNGGGPSTSSSITYQDVVLKFAATPTILPSGRIHLKIVQTNDSISGTQTISGNTVPIIASQSMTTTCEIAQGELVAMGGILSNSTETQGQGLRFVRKIPLLGRLLGKQKAAQIDTELIILIECRKRN